MMKLFAWFTLILFCLILLLLSLFRYSIPVKALSDPFSYVHLDILQALTRYELAQKSRATLLTLADKNVPVAHADTYDAVVDQLSRFEDSAAYPANIISRPDKTACQDLRLVLPDADVLQIDAGSLQTITGNACRYKIEDVKFSDDMQTMAVQMQAWENESDLFIQVYKLDNHQFKHVHTLFGRLKRPVAFAADNGVLYSDSKPGMLSDKKCRINKWLLKSDSCFLSDSDVPVAEASNTMLLHRAKFSDNFWVLFAHGTDDSGQVYEWIRSTAGNRFSATGLENVSRLVATSQGMLYVKSDSLTKNQLENEIQFFSYDQKNKSKLLASYPSLTTRFVNKDAAFLLRRKNLATGKFSLLSIDEQGEHSYPISRQVQDAATIEFLRNTNSPYPRLRLTVLSGEMSYGHVDQHGEFFTEQVKAYPYKTDTLNYFGRSEDGTEVPCTLVKKAGLSKPLPAVINVYAAYGLILRPQFSALQAVLHASEIASIYAHARGGGELGRKWAEAGRAIKKSNAIFDTEACINEAIRQQWIVPGKIVMAGASAGAPIAMMLALRNPSIVAGAWLDVPFLDTAGEHHNDTIDDEEFGNLKIADEALARRNWSPYQHLLKPDEQRASFLMTCSENDTRVPAWHCMKTDAALKNFHPNMRSFVYVANKQTHFSLPENADEMKQKDRIVLGFLLKILHP